MSKIQQTGECQPKEVERTELLRAQNGIGERVVDKYYPENMDQKPDYKNDISGFMLDKAKRLQAESSDLLFKEDFKQARDCHVKATVIFETIREIGGILTGTNPPTTQ